MAKLLYVKSSPKGEFSNSIKISDKFVEEYKALNPSDEVVTLDLYEEDLKFITAEDLATIFGAKDESSRNHPILKYAYQFVEADKYVFSTPMWNLGFPTVMKAYIDYISAVGITFKYTEQGPVGLCEGKKAVHFNSRGGDYSTEFMAPYEMGDRYLRTIIGFLGVHDFTTIAAEGTDVQTNDKDAIIAEAIAKGLELVKKF